ncbi:MAG: transporter substrate-binding domain-containing protein [Oscillospiraceae bacterium]|jgi:NitT/TauT family transport system substrate-binding protein|nr:transporter substrate-binding domain-containing protein [Oscillospiraceae bacterium]
MFKRASLALLLVAALLLGGCATAEKTPVRLAVKIAFIKGPTGMGAARLMEQNEAGLAANAYEIELASAPDAITGKLITGELDMAALPTNAIALLNARTNGQIQALAVNTLGVLYLLEKGDSVNSLADIAGKTIVAGVKGSTQEAVATYLFDEAEVTYVAEHAEAVAQAVAGKADLVMLPEPFVTSLLAQDAGFRIALDITAEWEAKADAMLPMGGIAVRRDFAEANPEAVAAFLAEYAESVAYVNENPAVAAEWIGHYEIMQAAVAKQAIPRSNMVCLTGDEMKTALESFYNILMESHPALIGDKLPDAAFYYAAP